MFQILRLSAECEQDEGWRSPSCACGLRLCHCGEPYIPSATPVCPACHKSKAAWTLVEHGEPLAPEWGWTCEKLYKLKAADQTRWSCSYQQRPSAEGGYWFAKYPPHYYEAADARPMNLYILVDPSLGKGRKSDRTAMGVIGLNHDMMRYVHDLIIERLQPLDRADVLFRLHRKWNTLTGKSLVVGYEEYGLMADSTELRAKMERENYRFQIISLGGRGEWHNLSKPDRIRMLIAQATRGEWWFPNPETPGRDATLADTVRNFVKDEWMRYPAVGHDDGLDMLSRINDPSLNAVFPIRRVAQVPMRQVGGYGASDAWMAS